MTTLDPNSDFTDNAAFVRIQDDLDSVRATLPSVDPYTYFDNAGASSSSSARRRHSASR